MEESIENKLKLVDQNFNASKNKAEELLKDKDKEKEKINQAFEKANINRSQLEEVWNNLQLLFSVVKDYLNGNYKEIPTGSMVAILACLLYFLSPIDLIPDFIPLIGYIDDVFVIALVIDQVHSDLKKYEDWKNTQQS